MLLLIRVDFLVYSSWDLGCHLLIISCHIKTHLPTSSQKIAFNFRIRFLSQHREYSNIWWKWLFSKVIVVIRQLGKHCKYSNMKRSLILQSAHFPILFKGTKFYSSSSGLHSSVILFCVSVSLIQRQHNI